MFNRRNFIFLAVLLLVNWLTASHVHASSTTSTLQELYKTSQAIETQLEKNADPLLIKQQVDRLEKLYTQLDLSQTPQSIEAIQRITAELIGLKMQLAAIRLPDKQLVKERIHRLKIGFESMADPKNATWKSIGKEIITEVERFRTAIGKGDRIAMQTVLQSITYKQREISIALVIHATPSQVNLLQSAVTYWEQTGASNLSAAKELLDSVEHYHATMLQILHDPVSVKSVPQVERDQVQTRSWWIAVFLLGISGFLIYRRLHSRKL